MTDFYDIIVVGGGPGGYVAAIRAAQLGMKTALVEKSELGGVCLNWGCIPTKALLRSAEVYRQAKHADDFGVAATGVSFDLNKIVERSRGVAKQMEKGIGSLLKKNKITHISGTASLAGKSASGEQTVAVKQADGKSITVRASHVILATGARARSLPGMEPDGKVIWTAREAMTPKAMPKSLVIVGAGAIGVEFATFYNTLGCKVTLLEVMPSVLIVEDKDIRNLAQKALVKEGIDVQTEIKISSVTKQSDGVKIVYSKAGKEVTLEADRMIVAAGVVGNTEGLGLEKTKVQVDRSFIKVDGFSATAEKGVYAIGDVSGPPCLAHKASHEAIICVEKIAGRVVTPLEKTNIPGCTYSHPQVASVGLNEEKAVATGRQLKIGKFPFIANGKAVAMGEPEGMVKVIFDAKTGELLGAHMIGAEVTEMIQGFAVAKTGELTEHEIMETVFPHPTMSEAMHEAVLAAFEGALHI